MRDLRKDVTIPMVFMTYANVVYSYGAEKFISTCKEIGIDGLILPDIPYEEKEEFLPLCEKYDVDLISFIAPCAIGFGISTPKQAKKMADISDGAIVGSAIIKIIDEYGDASPKYVGEYVKAMKDAL